MMSPEPSLMYAIGSSYLVRQSAGAERYDGATAQISRRPDPAGRIDIQLTDWKTNARIDDAEFLMDAASSAVLSFAATNLIDLKFWDITISRFAYHPADTSPQSTHNAVYNSLAAAFAQWQRLTLDLPGNIHPPN